MRRLTFALATLTASLAIAVTASAAGRTYQGNLGSGSLTFRIEQRALSSFRFLSIPISCKSGGETASGRDAADSFAVSGGSFHASLHASDPQFSGRIVLRGQLAGDSASGTFRLSGARVPIDGGGTGHRCDTGKMHWSAAAQ